MLLPCLHTGATAAVAAAKAVAAAVAAAVGGTVVGALLALASAGPGSAQQAPGGSGVVLVGVGGLRWEDLSPTVTPALWGLAEGGALGSISVRTTRQYTCPADGWATISAGRRATAPRQAEPADLPEGTTWPICPALPEPEESGAGVVIPGWEDWRRVNAEDRFDAELGTLGRAAGGSPCTTAVGPGAALALADATGALARYFPDPAVIAQQELTACALTVIDLGSVGAPGWETALVSVEGDPLEVTAGVERTADEGLLLGGDLAPRAEQVAALDARIGRLLEILPTTSDLLLVTLADSSRQSHLGAALARGPSYVASWLDSRSTRRPALVQLTDVQATVLERAGLDRPRDSIGAVIRANGERPRVLEAVDELVDQDTAAVVTGRLLAPFTTFLVLSQLVLYSAAAVALRRRWGGPAARMRVLRATRAAALGFAALPVASYLANLVRWWKQDYPLAGLLVALATAAVAVAAVAMLGPWRRHILGPPTAVAAITALVLAVDVARGSALQLNAVLGYSPLVAGRFYGFGNIPFAVWATSAVIATAGIAAALVERGRRRAAGSLALVVGLAAVAINGGDALGADFGGVIALVPGFAVLAMTLAGLRVTPARLGLSIAAGLLAITAISTLAWSLEAPQDRSHLGRFVQQVIDGEAVNVVQRKLEANLGLLFGTPYGLIVPAAVGFLVFVLMRPLQWRAAALQRAYYRAPTLRPALTATTVTLVVGFAVNDSGIVIPAVGLAIAVPLALAASVTALVQDELEGHPPGGLDGDGPGHEPERAPPGPARSTA